MPIHHLRNGRVNVVNRALDILTAPDYLQPYREEIVKRFWRLVQRDTGVDTDKSKQLALQALDKKFGDNCVKFEIEANKYRNVWMCGRLK